MQNENGKIGKMYLFFTANAEIMTEMSESRYNKSTAIFFSCDCFCGQLHITNKSANEQAIIYELLALWHAYRIYVYYNVIITLNENREYGLK